MTKQAITLAGRRVDLVIVDAMFTLLVPRKKSKWRMILDIYRRIGQLGPEITDKMLKEKIIEVRQRVTPLAKVVCKHICEIWRIVNTEVLFELGVPLTWAAPRGKKINRYILSCLVEYKVDKQLRRFIKELHAANVRIVIGSNQSRNQLLRHLRHNGMLEWVDALYTSEEFGVYKPNPIFWQQILDIEDIEATNVIHIGNSANADIGAAELGVKVILIDREGELVEFSRGHLDQSALPDHPDIEQVAALLNRKLIKVYDGIDPLRSAIKHVRLENAVRA